MAARKKTFTPEEVIALFEGIVSFSKDEVEAEETLPSITKLCEAW